MRPFSLYIHIPYCLHKCPYCDFNTYAVPVVPEHDYTSAVLAELDYRAHDMAWRGRTVQTIYFGGGTPSLLGGEAIRRMIAGVQAHFPFTKDIEISLEANPGTVTSDSVASYVAAGVNRLSLGAQSFQKTTLSALGRIHSPEETENAVHLARDAGLNNINIDLMFGIPGQLPSDLEYDLARALKLDPQHISPYALTIEKGTPFFLAHKRGVFRLPTDEVVIAMMKILNRALEDSGFERYEISNFSLPGYAARHNMAYWNRNDYLGLGAGAHSYVRAIRPSDSAWGNRWSNMALPAQYMKTTAERGEAVSWRDTLDLKGAMFEFFFLGLRKMGGVDPRAFNAEFGCTVDDVYGPTIKILTQNKLLRREPERLALSPKGILLADSVIENFATPEIPADFVAIPQEPAVQGI